MFVISTLNKGKKNEFKKKKVKVLRLFRKNKFLSSLCKYMICVSQKNNKTLQKFANEHVTVKKNI